MSYKKLGFIMTGVSVLTLVGCSHSNPLTQYGHEQVASDLLASAVSAEMTLGLAKHTYQAGYYYMSCMSGKKPQNTCKKLYKTMWKNLKSQYSGLTVSDLQDKKLWSFVKEYYQQDAFNRLPE